MNAENSNRTLVVESQYLPPVSAFIQMRSFQEMVINGAEAFKKSTWRNRCAIAGANGKILLSVPVVGGRGVRSKTKDVRIDYSSPWQHQHWKSIKSAYGKSSYFFFYEDRFLPFYEKHFEFLIDFNTQLLQLCFSILHWEKKISVIQTEESDSSQSTASKVKLQTSNFLQYHQVFEHRHGFIPDLSIVDLIFNSGNEALLYLERLALQENL